ncbi:MAG: type secretion protein [Pseudomonadota bacterium]|nr:type secretion protein [Pseudomonadota bacterium]
MIYLNILDGSQAGNYIEITPNTKLSMASSFGSDIYLLLPSWDAFECNFTLSDNKITFHNTTDNFLVNSLPVETDTPYETPILCNIEGVNVAFSNNPYAQISDFTQTQTPEFPTNDEQNSETEPMLTELNELGITPFEEEKPEPGKFVKFISKFWDKFNNSKLKKQLAAVFAKAKQSPVFSIIKKISGLLGVELKQQTNKIYKKIGMWLYIIVGTTIVITIGLIISLHQIHTNEQIEIAIHDHQLTKSLLEQQVFKLPNRYSNLRISNNRDDIYQLNGAVGNAADIQYLHKTFNKIYPKLKYNIILVDKIKPQLLLDLQQHKIIRPRVEYESSSGTLSIQGIANSMDVIDDVEIVISNQYPELGKIDSSNMFLANDIDNSLDSIINNDKYKQHLEVNKNYEEGTIKIAGYLAASDITELNNQIDKFNQKYSNAVKVILDVQDLIKALPFGVSEVYTGSPAWIITNDGQRIYQGGSYKGISVLLIDNEKIVFKGKFTLSLMLNQLLPSSRIDITNTGATYGSADNSSANPDTVQNPMIATEKKSEVDIIAKEQSQLQSLKLILQKTDDKELQSSLKETIQNLEDDLKYRQTDYQYYFKESATK